MKNSKYNAANTIEPSGYDYDYEHQSENEKNATTTKEIPQSIDTVITSFKAKRS